MAKKHFASLDENGVVVNTTTVSYPYTLFEYSKDKSITNNEAGVGDTYDAELNAFIPPKPKETYILNIETFSWEPDPNLEYTIGGVDGPAVDCRWSPKLKEWITLQNWSDEEYL